MTVTKKEIIKRIADRVGQSQARTKETLRMTLEVILETAMENGRVELRDFGVFEVRHRKGRKARNPRTGEDVQVPATAVLAFKPGKKLRDKVARSGGLPQAETVSA